MPVTVPIYFTFPSAGRRERAAPNQASEMPTIVSPRSNSWSYTIL